MLTEACAVQPIASCSVTVYIVVPTTGLFNTGFCKLILFKLPLLGIQLKVKGIWPDAVVVSTKVLIHAPIVVSAIVDTVGLLT